MMNALASSTTNAGAAIDYLLDDKSLNKQTGRMEPRDPLPTMIEGDPEAFQLLCDGLSFKHQYTSGVLTFSPEETAKIDATPGLKETILEDFKAFAFAGVPEGSRSFLAVEHRHTGRLEMHYLIPRVNLDSGRYFNPFPPNYNGKRGAGQNKGFLAENDAYIDYACQRFGLQNPRDPAIARAAKRASDFDPRAKDKRAINDHIIDLVASGDITSREDIVNFFKNAGATITRNGDTYLSVKFEGDKKAMRFEGKIYDKATFGSFAESIREAERRQEVTPAEIEQKYAGVLARRIEETEYRHYGSKKGVDRGQQYDNDAARDFGERAAAIKGFKNGVDRNFGAGTADSLLYSVLDSAQDARIDMGQLEIDLAGPAHTEDPVLNWFIQQAHKYVMKLISEKKNADKKLAAAMEHSQRALRKQMEQFVKGFLGITLGRNLVRPISRPMSAREIEQLGKELRTTSLELEREVTAFLQRPEPTPAPVPAQPELSTRELIKRLESNGLKPMKVGKMREQLQPKTKGSRYDDEGKSL
ncbi:relaxase family protein [Pseudomonas aeruginosa]